MERSGQYGSVVIGSPGAGKTSYCRALQQWFSATSQRQCAVINLDPANAAVPYECAADIRDLITIDEAMDAHGLGPNGALLFCLEVLERNLDWLAAALARCRDAYVLLDCPGQIELFTHHDSLRNVLHRLTFKTTLRLCVVNLVDSHHVTDGAKYVSLLLVSLATMLQLQLPHVNVLSKVDLTEQFGLLVHPLERYAEARDLAQLLGGPASRRQPPRFAKLNEALAELVEEFSLVHFTVLNIQDAATVANVVRLTDKACGYVYGAEELSQVIQSHAAELDIAELYEAYRKK